MQLEEDARGLIQHAYETYQDCGSFNILSSKLILELFMKVFNLDKNVLSAHAINTVSKQH